MNLKYYVRTFLQNSYLYFLCIKSICEITDHLNENSDYEIVIRVYNIIQIGHTLRRAICVDPAGYHHINIQVIL